MIDPRYPTVVADSRQTGRTTSIIDYMFANPSSVVIVYSKPSLDYTLRAAEHAWYTRWRYVTIDDRERPFPRREWERRVFTVEMWRQRSDRPGRDVEVIVEDADAILARMLHTHIDIITMAVERTETVQSFRGRRDLGEVVIV